MTAENVRYLPGCAAAAPVVPMPLRCRWGWHGWGPWREAMLRIDRPSSAEWLPAVVAFKVRWCQRCGRLVRRVVAF